VRIIFLEKMGKIIRTELWQALLGILFPECCLGCGVRLAGRQPLVFCHICMDDVHYLEPPLCTCCGKPFDKAAGASHYCSQCLTRQYHYKQARAAVKYLEPVAKAVRQFKYGAKTSGLSTFANLMHQYLQCHPLPEVDAIIPVPLHKKRLRQRGFNQALVLTRNFFPQDQNKIEPLILKRHAWTHPQTGLNRTARKRNVKNAFAVRQPGKIKDKRILLVDDVYTTGATVNECARILNRNGALEVHVLTLARAVD
jgi:ComF family protein